MFVECLNSWSSQCTIFSWDYIFLFFNCVQGLNGPFMFSKILLRQLYSDSCSVPYASLLIARLEFRSNLIKLTQLNDWPHMDSPFTAHVKLTENLTSSYHFYSHWYKCLFQVWSYNRWWWKKATLSLLALLWISQCYLYYHSSYWIQNSCSSLASQSPTLVIKFKTHIFQIEFVFHIQICHSYDI